MKYYIYCLIAMALASYLPRVIPLLFFRKQIKSRFIKSFLFYIPYAVLTAVTFPAIFYCTGNIHTAVIGTAIALLLSYFKVNMALVALICVAVVFGLGFII